MWIWLNLAHGGDRSPGQEALEINKFQNLFVLKWNKDYSSKYVYLLLFYCSIKSRNKFCKFIRNIEEIDF